MTTLISSKLVVFTSACSLLRAQGQSQHAGWHSRGRTGGRGAERPQLAGPHTDASPGPRASSPGAPGPFQGDWLLPGETTDALTSPEAGRARGGQVCKGRELFLRAALVRTDLGRSH